jgi:MPBQ/MSBQ methyltransferase
LCGHAVVGIDLSTALLEKARKKNAEAYLSRDLFAAPFPFVSAYSDKIRRLANAYRGNSPLGKSEFKVASASSLPFPDATFDLVNCCGSTLSFVGDYCRAISEMARVLKPGGILFVEVENKYNLDLLWPLFDSKVFSGRLGYDQSKETVSANLRSPRLQNLKIAYPFSGKEGDVDMPIWLFSAGRIIEDFRTAGCAVKAVHSVPSITNLLPSVALDQPTPSPRLSAVFGMLSSIEEVVASWPIIRRVGCSLILMLVKE